MKPLAELDARPARYVLLDLDDTLTSAGKLTAEAYAAPESLQRHGKRVIPVTGRPAGWCDHIARMWPVDAVVGENGAFYFWFSDGKLGKRFIDDAQTRAQQRSQLTEIAARILAQVPGAAIASDQLYRETDLAIDYREDVAPLPLESAECIAELMRRAGLTAKVSSIHVNGWFGHYDKLATTRLLLPSASASLWKRRTTTWSTREIRRTMRPCSSFSTTRSAWPMCAGFRVSRPGTSPRARPGPGSPSSRSTFCESRRCSGGSRISRSASRWAFLPACSASAGAR